MGLSQYIVKMSASEYHNHWVYYVLNRYYKRYNAFIEMGFSCEKAQKMACFKFTDRYFTLNKQAEPLTESDMSSFKNFLNANNKTNRVQKFYNNENILCDFKRLSKGMRRKYYYDFADMFKVKFKKKQTI